MLVALVWFQTILLVAFAGQAGFYHQENRAVSRVRLRSRSALILVQGVRHQRAKVTVLTGLRDYLRACAVCSRDTICGAVVELDMILRFDPSRNTDQGV